jgi:hypothetical protein
MFMALKNWLARSLHKGAHITKQALMKNHQESTYALLVRSEERSRGALETVAYTTIFLSLLVAIWQFVQNPVNIRAGGLEPGIVGVTEAANSPS